MLNPPFRPAVLSTTASWAGSSDVPVSGGSDTCCEHDAPEAPAQLGARARLGELNPHLHCSLIGTCLSTSELRKLMARFIHVEGASDLDVHHEAVRLASASPDAAKALHKALDRRHEAVVTRFNSAKDAPALAALWDEALRSGEIPGAYWALMTHRRLTTELRQRAFGDVHMLSHLVGSANRADIRRLVALEQENARLRERNDDQQVRLASLATERDRGLGERELLSSQVWELQSRPGMDTGTASALGRAQDQIESLTREVGVQTQRRELAEAAANTAQAESARVQQELARLQDHLAELTRELSAAEAQLRESDEDAEAGPSPLHEAINGKRVLYVGGRPSSNPAIRSLVLRHGGEYQRHDGGIEDRKGLLASALAWADLVVFPVDCVDHESALALKRSCMRQGRPFAPLRSASVASFAAGVAAMGRNLAREEADDNGMCRKHA